MSGVVPVHKGSETAESDRAAYSQAVLHPRVSGNPVLTRPEYRYTYGMAPMWAVRVLRSAELSENRCG